MEKKKLVATCLAVPGGIFFSIGMVMALIVEWNLFIPGIVVGAIGIILLFLIYPIYRKLGNYPKMKFSAKGFLIYSVGILSTLLLGIGMCFVLAIESPQTWHLLVGIIIGVVGIIGIILNIIINLSYKNKKISGE